MTYATADLFGFASPTVKRYKPVLTATENRKGVLDVDTVKGCTVGMARHSGGCYGACYAAKTARIYGIDFTTSVSRRPVRLHRVLNSVVRHPAPWYRIGVAGDPSHDWENTVTVCELLRYTKKIPVIVTKHWYPATDDQLQRLVNVGAVFNTSTSAMDTDTEVEYRIGELRRVAAFGMRSVCRVVTCEFGSSEWARHCNEKQKYLLAFSSVIDTPFRTTTKHARVVSGDILLTRRKGVVGGGSHMVSMWSGALYLGVCANCPDQCGVETQKLTVINGQEKVAA